MLETTPGAQALGWLLFMNLAAGIAFAAALACDHLLARRVAARTRLLLYAAVLLRLAVPRGFDLGLLSSLSPPPAAIAWLGAAAPPAAGPARADRPAHLPGPGLDAGGLVLPVWAAGAALLAALALRRRRILLRSLASAVPARPGLRTPAAEVLEHPTLGPAVVGIWRPRIVVPRPLADSLPAEALAWILRHESAHVARRDGLLLALGRLLAILLWPVLPVWLALGRVRALVEHGCDEEALLGAGDAAARRSYGEALLAVAERCPLPALLRIAALGGDLEGRVRALRHARRWHRLPATAAVLAAGIGTVLLSGASRPARAESEAGVPIALGARIFAVEDSRAVLPEYASPDLPRGSSGVSILSRKISSGEARRIEELLAAGLMSAPDVVTTSGQAASISSRNGAGEGFLWTFRPVLGENGTALRVDYSCGNAKAGADLDLAPGETMLVILERWSESGPAHQVLTITPERLRGTLTFPGTEQEVRAAYRAIAEAAGRNLVLHRDIAGRVALAAGPAGWRAALAALERRGFEHRVADDLILAAPAGRLGEMTDSLARGSSRTLVSLDLDGADLHDVLRYLEPILGRELRADPALRGRVTLRLADVEAGRAFELLLASQGLDAVSEGRALRIVRSR